MNAGKPRRTRVVVLLALAALFVTGMVLSSQHPAARCALLPMLDEQRFGDELFVHAGVADDDARAFERLLPEAAKRIRDRYGAPRSAPRLLLVPDAEVAGQWDANATATLHRAPWGTCIVVGPDGRNVDVIAHEWLHAEIQHRVGFWRFLREIPTWFDEGAALTVDHRAPFLPANIDLPPSAVEAVQALDRGAAFFRGDVRTHYQAARLAVISRIDEATFFDDLERIAAGEAFEAVFAPHAAPAPTREAQ